MKTLLLLLTLSSCVQRPKLGPPMYVVVQNDIELELALEHTGCEPCVIKRKSNEHYILRKVLQ